MTNDNFNSNKDYDVIIVGSGPGGSLLARNLSSSGARVLVLEKGQYHSYSDSPFSQLPMIDVLFTDGFKSILRGITAGGTSMLYFATATPVPHDMFEQRGIDLSEHEETIENELPIQPLSDDLLSEHALHLREAAHRAGFNDWEALPKMIHPDRIEPGHQPITARWNAREFLEEAVEQGTNLLTQAEVTEILYSGGSVDGVKFNHDGSVHNAQASTVISAAGGIGSASLFKQSELPISDGFFCDPLVAVMGASDSFQETFKPLPMLSGTHDPENGITLTDMPMPWPVHSVFSLQTLRPDLIFKKSKTLTIMVKIRDELAGSIEEHDNVSRNLTEADRNKLNTGIDRAEKILEEAGVDYTSVTEVTSAHPGGSIRIGDRVDANLETMIDGLFVCDASVIPEAWGLPPTRTLLSLADRLSEHLIENKSVIKKEEAETDVPA